MAITAGSTISGSVAIPTGTTLILQGTNTFTASSSLAGAGAVQFQSGTNNINGTYNITGSTTVSGGTDNFNSPFTSLGNPLTVSGGTCNLGSNNLSIPVVNFTGGTLTGSGTLTGVVVVNAGTTYTGTPTGTITGVGAATVTCSAVTAAAVATAFAQPRVQ